LQSGPWLEVEEDREGAAEIPIALVAGSELEVGVKREVVTADILGILGREKRVGEGSAMAVRGGGG